MRFPLEMLRHLEQVDNLDELVIRLEQPHYSSLALSRAAFDGEYHLSAPAASLYRGLLAVYVPNDRTPTLDGADEHRAPRSAADVNTVIV